ncbi:hypothetical protein LHEJCM20397_12590 [Lactobacillus helveticus]|nr:hypothetical protein LHEJCM1006_11200 [Lactobacillus helveticus]GFP17711.1 hypothetical protein LHEJCM20397_12590 [Lactobacillus helveticus]
MDSLHSTMNQHVKGKHLSFEERVIIQTRLKDGCSIRAIARELGCSPSTISYEVRRGTVSLYHGKQKRCKADQGQSVYQINRCHCGRKSAFLKKAGFINYVIKHFFEDGWLLDVCANRSLATGEFSHYQTVCTRPLPASCRLFKCFKNSTASIGTISLRQLLLIMVQSLRI